MQIENPQSLALFYGAIVVYFVLVRLKTRQYYLYPNEKEFNYFIFR